MNTHAAATLHQIAGASRIGLISTAYLVREVCLGPEPDDRFAAPVTT